MKPYIALLEKCVFHDLPKAYKDDVLVHDKQAIEENQDQDFVWCLGPSGTQVIFFKPSIWNGKKHFTVPRNLWDAVRTNLDMSYFYWWDHDKEVLHPIQKDQLDKLIEEKVEDEEKNSIGG